MVGPGEDSRRDLPILALTDRESDERCIVYSSSLEIRTCLPPDAIASADAQSSPTRDQCHAESIANSAR